MRARLFADIARTGAQSRPRHSAFAPPAAEPGPGAIAKIDPELRVVWAWASVATEHGRPLTDTQGDQIDDAELRAAAHDFLRSGRVLAGHAGAPVGELVESVALTAELQAALGFELAKTGWLVAIRVTDEPTWQAVRSGRLGALSIGGFAVREPAA